MAKLVWDAVGDHLYETGVDQGVLYLQNAGGAYPEGVAWNGLTAVTESPEGAEATDLYADNIKYLSLRSAETFGATIEAYTYPDEFGACDGTAEPVPGVKLGQQNRATFGLCYRTVMGNDTEMNDHGYKLHLIYGATASPSEKAYNTINDSPEAITFSWEIKTVPVALTGDYSGYKPTACIVIDSTKFTTTEQKAKLTTLENKLFGTNAEGQNEGTTPYLPLPNEVISTLS
jgi:hypothetical protein